jgi:exodeoxyribonuclease V alpha subunit
METRPLDRALASMLLRRGGLEDDVLEAAIAQASAARGAGHLCVEVEGDLSGPLVRKPAEERPSPLVQDADRLYLDRNWQDESRIVSGVRQRLACSADLSAADAQALVDAVIPDEDPRQDRARDAVLGALTRPLCIVTGGPGTGKTTVVARIVEALRLDEQNTGRAPRRIALAAPSGKAADRLSEEVRAVDPSLAGQTLHSALGVLNLDTGAFRHGRADPMPVDVLVLDEASMVDASLMARAFDALHPNSRFILLGDPDQLRSVDYGAVLGDLLRASEANADLASCVVRLEHNWRTTGTHGLNELAQAIRDRDAQALRDVVADQTKTDVQCLDPGRGRAGMALALRDLVLKRWSSLPKDAQAALKQFKALRLLAAHRHGPRGVSGLNQLVEDWLQEAGSIRCGSPWYNGRPVLVRRNDKALGLRNGNVGLVRGDRVHFDLGGPRDFAPSLLPEHQTCFAMTVHKAQGSEAEEVIVVLPKEDSPLLTRELLYTAVTRARTRVTLVGSVDVMVTALAQSEDRASGLVARLA